MNVKSPTKVPTARAIGTETGAVAIPATPANAAAPPYPTELAAAAESVLLATAFASAGTKFGVTAEETSEVATEVETEVAAGLITVLILVRATRVLSIVGDCRFTEA